jgi:hypothetical protein
MRAGTRAKGGMFTHPAANSATPGKRNVSTEIEYVEWYTGPWPPVVNAYRSEYWQGRTHASKHSYEERIARKRKRGGGNLCAEKDDEDGNANGTLVATVSFDSSCWVLSKGKLCPRLRANASAPPNSSYSLRGSTSNRLLMWHGSQFGGSLDDDECQLWDPSRATLAIKKGEKIEDFLAQAKELNMKMLYMEALHRSSYNVSAAKQTLDQVTGKIPETCILQPSLIRDKVLEVLNSSDQISVGKKFTQVARQLGCRKEMLLVHYYIWKSTTCAVCNESGGQIVECPLCYAPYHSSCIPGRDKSASKVSYFQPCSHCGITKRCKGSKVCSPATLAVVPESAILDVSIPNYLQWYKDSTSDTIMKIADHQEHTCFARSHPLLGSTDLQPLEFHLQQPGDFAKEVGGRDVCMGAEMDSGCDHMMNEALHSPVDATMHVMGHSQVCHCRCYRRSLDMRLSIIERGVENAL